jgi:hypothetical protein
VRAARPRRCIPNCPSKQPAPHANVPSECTRPREGITGPGGDKDARGFSARALFVQRNPEKLTEVRAQRAAIVLTNPQPNLVKHGVWHVGIYVHVHMYYGLSSAAAQPSPVQHLKRSHSTDPLKQLHAH